MRKTRSKKNSFNWNKVQRFSIRKLSFGVASCMIGAQFVLSGLPNTVDAALIQTREQQEGHVTTLYANTGDSPLEAGGSGVYDKVNVDKEIGIQVDWSQYSKTNPYVKVTYKYNGGYGAEALNNYGGGRPDFWFTTPKGASEPTSITLYNLNTGKSGREMTSWSGEKPWVSFTNSVGSRYQNGTDASALNNGDPSKWERYNDSTNESGRTYRGDLNTMFWRRIGDTIEGDQSEQGIYESFKNHTKSMYSDWQKAADPTATIEATYKVVDPTLKNGTLTLEFGAGVKVGHAASLVTHFKTVTVEVPVLYQDSELFEVKVPERTGVGNTEALTKNEKDDIKDKIVKANENNTSSAIPGNTHNKFIDNLKEGIDNIVIGNDGTATITYLDNSTDTIPGTSLVYEKTDPNETKTDTKNEQYNYKYNPYVVENINALTPDDLANAKANFYAVNGMKYRLNEDGEWEITSVSDSEKSGGFLGTNLQINQRTGEGYILNGNRPNGIRIPKEHLFKQRTGKAFDLNEAIEKGKKAIDNLNYLSQKEKDELKIELATKTTQDDINTVVNKAIAKNSENEAGIEAKKREIKDKINNAKYLTKEQKDQFLEQVKNQKITDDPTDGSSVSPLEYTKGLLNQIGQQVDAKNLEKAKEQAKAKIEKIKDDLTDPTADTYNNRIDDPNTNTTSAVEAIVTDAKNQKAQKDKAKAQEEANTLKDEYKKKIDQIPGLTDDQRTKYKEQIDNAKSKGQLDNILKDAEAAGTRAKAIETINNLSHLNDAQKAALVERVNDATDKEEINDIVTEAQNLDSKMHSLQQLVEKAEEVKKTVQYTNATGETKNNFDTALTNADAVAKKSGTEAGSSEVDKLINELKKGIAELTGTTVNTPVSKDALNAEIAKEEEVKKSPEYLKDTADKQKAYNDALTYAKKMQAKEDATQGDVNDALNKLQKARTELNGKVTDFTLAVASGTVEISKESIDANTLMNDEDKNAVKAKLTVDNASVKDTDKVEYGNITEKDGKKYVTVIVTRDGVSKEDKVEVVQKKEAFQVELNDTEAVNISKEPVKGETLSEADQAKVKAKIKDLKDDDIVSYSSIAEKDGKKVVTVTVTRGTSKATVDVEVVHIKTAEEHAKKLKAPENKVKVTDTNHLTVKEKEAVKKAVADANPGLTEDKIKVDDQGYVETPLGNLEPKDVITSALKKPTTPVNVNNPSKLTKEEKDKVVEEIVKNNPDLADKKDKINVDDQGNVETPKGNLPAGDVVVPALKKPTTPVVVKNPDQLTNEEKEAVKDAIIAVNPDLAGKKDKINVDNQGNVETPNGNLPKEDVVTIVLNKPAAPVVVSNPNSLTDEEKDKVKDAVAKANPGLNKKDIEVDNQGNVKTPNGGLPAKDVITSNLNKPTAPVKVTDPSKLTKEEKDKVVEEIVKNNPDLAGKEDKINVDDQGNVETPKGNLPAGDVVTPVLNVPTKPIVVGNPESLTEKEKEAVKKAVADANPGLTEDKIKVDNQGNVVTPNGNIPAEYIVKASKGASVTRPDLPELSVQDALVAGVLTVKKGTVLTDDDILKQLTLVGDVTANVKSKPSTDTVGDFTAEVEITLADGSKKTVIVPVKVYEGERPEVNDLGKAKEDAKKQVEDAANKKIEEINKRTDLSDPEKTAAIEKVNKAKNDANTQIENATSAGTAKAIGEETAKKITEFQPEHDSVKLVDPSKLDEEKAKAIAEIEQAAKNQTDSINNNKDLTPSQKEEAIKKIEELKAKAIEDVRKADTVDKVKDIVKNVEAAIKQVNPQPIPTPQPQPGGNTGGNSGNNTGNTSNQNAQANSDALANARKAAENILEEAARAKKAQLEEAGLSEAEKEELFAKVEAEKQAALDEIAKAKDVEEVKQLVMKAVAKIKAIQPARNAQDNQDSQEAQNAQNAQDAQNHSNSNPSSLVAANGRGQELPATGTGSEFVVFNAAAISILTGLGLAIPSKKKETEE